MVSQVPDRFGDLLEDIGLVVPLRDVKYGIPSDAPNFFNVLERYSPRICTFFTSVEENGIALHEM